MLDIKAICNNPEYFKVSLKRKGVDPLLIDNILTSYNARNKLLQKIENIKYQQNKISETIINLENEEKNKVLEDMKKLAEEKKKLEKELANENEIYTNMMDDLPNPPFDSAPDGDSDAENIVVRQEGEKPTFSFQPKEHWELGVDLDILDIERASKVSGTRFYYLKNELAILQRALAQWAFMEVIKKGYNAIIPPFLTRKEAIYGTGYLAKGENYIVNPNEDDLYLIGTSEVPVTSYYADEIIDLSNGPKKFVSYSPCFRKEAGSSGKDTKGILRVHQFEKIEMVIFCTPEQSDVMHEEIREIEEYLLQQLGIPYQVINVCCGDLGNSAVKKYDIEAWLPGQNKYREMTSTSICTDFQSRRLNIRYKTKEDKNEYVHTLNGTAVSSRPLIAIMENFQNEDGSIDIPKVLQPFCGFRKIETMKHQ